ncbi:MAG: hypothetical protein SFW67_23305 [Myxococcaceae bacterium]|nr:hypothetical protein [Myxococcaceae bacterium]
MTTSPLTRRSLFVLLLALPLLTGAAGRGCGGEDSSVVRQDRIFTQYWLYYDANTDVTYARATFRLGNALGTLLELNDPAKVTFNEKALSYVDVPGWHEAQFPGKVTGTFVYTNVDGQRFSVPVSAIPDVSVPAMLSIPAGQAFTFAWQGPAIAREERLEVIVTGENKLDFSVIDQRGVGATDVVIPADKTRRFNAMGWLGVRRTQESAPMQAPDAGGMVWSTMQPKDARVQWGSSADGGLP